jgi:hypothetical protein
LPWIHVLVFAVVWVLPPALLGRFIPIFELIQQSYQLSAAACRVIDFARLNQAYCYGPVLLVLAASLGVYGLIVTLARPVRYRMLYAALWLTSVDLIGLLQWPTVIKFLWGPISRWGDL